MKKLLPALLILAFACKKSSTPYVAPPSSTKLTSVKGYANNVIARVDTFMYTTGDNLLTQKEWTYTNECPTTIR
jgi:hypothetical protein